MKTSAWQLALSILSLTTSIDGKPLQPPYKAPLKARQSTDFGRFLVTITASELGVSSTVEVQDAFPDPNGGGAVASPGQSTTCVLVKSELSPSQSKVCNTGAWSAWYYAGPVGQPDVLSIAHYVQYNTVMNNSLTGTEQVTHKREASQIPIFLNDPAPAKEYTLCEKYVPNKDGIPSDVQSPRIKADYIDTQAPSLAGGNGPGCGAISSSATSLGGNSPGQYPGPEFGGGGAPVSSAVPSPSGNPAGNP